MVKVTLTAPSTGPDVVLRRPVKLNELGAAKAVAAAHNVTRPRTSALFFMAFSSPKSRTYCRVTFEPVSSSSDLLLANRPADLDIHDIASAAGSTGAIHQLPAWRRCY